MTLKKKSRGLLVVQIVTDWFSRIKDSRKLNKNLLENLKKLYDKGQITRVKNIIEIITEG